MLFIDMTSQPHSDSDNEDEAVFDPYTTYNLSNIRGGYKQLTDIRKCLNVDFNDIKVLLG